jgi:hypothetical protein
VSGFVRRALVVGRATVAAGGFYQARPRRWRIRNDRVKFAPSRADAKERMLLPAPPMSNAERQRRFQDAHPGYDRRRKARQRGSEKRGAAQLAAQLAAKLHAAGEVEAAASLVQSLPLHARAQLLLIPVPTTRLALPAPVEMPVLPAINDIHALLDHTTVLHAVRTVDGDCNEDPEIIRQITHIDGQLTS